MVLLSEIQLADVALTSQNQHADKGCPHVYGISERELSKPQAPVTMSNTLHGSFVVSSETLQKCSTRKIANAALTSCRRGVRAITRAQQVAEVQRPALQQSTPKKVSLTSLGTIFNITTNPEQDGCFCTFAQIT